MYVSTLYWHRESLVLDVPWLSSTIEKEQHQETFEDFSLLKVHGGVAGTTTTGEAGGRHQRAMGGYTDQL
jgi:hypothetical protein